jgi:hypothetical protein
MISGRQGSNITIALDIQIGINGGYIVIIPAFFHQFRFVLMGHSSCAPSSKRLGDDLIIIPMDDSGISP